jgi:hypothetical protein
MDKAKKALDELKGEAQPFPWWTPEDHITEEDPVKIYVSIPTYDNKVSLVVDSCLKAAFATSRIGKKRLLPQVHFMGGDSLISRARDKMAAHFLQTDAEWHLQIDDDIVFPSAMGPEAAKFYKAWMNPEIFNAFLAEGVFKAALQLNAIDEILRSGIVDGKKLVGGLYFWRGGSKSYNQAASLLPYEKGGDAFQIEFKLRPDNYVDTDKLATGFMLTHRSVYEDIMKKFPELAYDVPPVGPKGQGYSFYQTNITEERDPQGRQYKFYRSEDYAFAWRAAQCGHVPCLNMNILLGHVGTHIYSWFDRPSLQSLIFDMYGNDQHSIERVEPENQ